MSILVRFEPTSVTTTEQHDGTIRRLEQGGDSPDGLEYHVCFYADGQLRVSEVWESQEQIRGLRAAPHAHSRRDQDRQVSRRSSRSTTPSGARSPRPTLRATEEGSRWRRI